MRLRNTLVVAACTCAAWHAHGTTPEDAGQAAFRAIYEELVEIDTTLSAGDCTRAANAMATHLRAAGYADTDLHVIVPPDMPKQGNLVASFAGSDASLEPLLLLAHIDVVEAKRADWARNPFTLIEEDGYFYGRGTADDKAMAAIFVDAMMRYRRGDYAPARGIKLALTCGEETPNHFDGAKYLVDNHRALIDAAFALNEGGGGRLDGERRVYNGVQAGEKVYQDFTLEITNPGGHSSRPVKDNAIYRLAAAIGRIEAHEFPVEINETTRAFLARMAGIVGGEVGEDMRAILAMPPDPDALARIVADASRNSILRTTCVVTQLDAGHAPNALPQRARANVNCRILPAHSQEEVRRELERVVADSGIAVSFEAPPEHVAPPPPLTEDVMLAIERVTEEMWPGVPVVPTMAAGATDARFLTPAGIPTYGVSGIFSDPETTRAHGLDERMRVQSLYEGREFLDRLIKSYTGG
jgi:acetylornithine deacetylase/succinyl-diaminopimelate desuccinylase-like protein